jgi:hypothetical protein
MQQQLHQDPTDLVELLDVSPDITNGITGLMIHQSSRTVLHRSRSHLLCQSTDCCTSCSSWLLRRKKGRIRGVHY